MNRHRNLRIACVSIDLDEIDCYAAIHGIDLPKDAQGAIYDFAVPRFERLFGDFHIPATFFAIGRDLKRSKNSDAIARLHKAGHEIANHSMNHLYDLTRQPAHRIASEVSDGADIIEAACGERPVGFRAPGYTINESVFETLESQGLLYDSSVFPCPAYYSAKTAAISTITLRGRKSHSVVDDPRVLGAPADPYLRGRPYWTQGMGMLEMPIGVTRTLRLPYIGTSVALSGARGARMLSKRILGRPLVNLELHGIDLSDAQRDGLMMLKPHQPDLRRSMQQKELALRSAFRTLKDNGYTFMTMKDAAEAFLRH